MASRNKPTAELIINLIQRIPEGVITLKRLSKKYKVHNHSAEALKKAVATGHIGVTGDVYFDSSRLSADEARDLALWARPEVPTPPGEEDGKPQWLDAPIVDQLEARGLLVNEDEAALIHRLSRPRYAERAAFTDDEVVLERLIERGVLRQEESLIYDPLRVSAFTVRDILRQRALTPLRDQVIAFLDARKGKTAPRLELEQEFGRGAIDEMLTRRWFPTFQMVYKRSSTRMQWVMLPDADPAKAQKAAAAESRIKDTDWREFLDVTGEVMRDGAKDGKTYRSQVLARSYTLTRAAKRLGAHEDTLERAIKRELISAFEDPEGALRLPADEVERAYEDPAFALYFTGSEVINVKELALVADIPYSALRGRLNRERINPQRIRWEQVRGKWGLPQHLYEYRALAKQRRLAYRAEKSAAAAEQMRSIHEAERARRDALRARLAPIFPTWRHGGREVQQVTLHVGPPNSGKTHDALNALVAAGSGWYLAPLRLLAYEIFDRLNRRGVYCNLLTGEEYIPIPGATITASTIEMFQPEHSGQCVIIDEAQMLADPDRGWAWTRALMEAQAPEIHVLGSLNARHLIENLAKAVELPLRVVDHERLAPIHVADAHFRLDDLPPRTILVAFSRWMVLTLKLELDKLRRSTSVIYGSLPPEVRRKQADRFAAGETEICIATDAVGMGLNLPADHVVFYELEKYDGTERRTLMPSEVQQIGGRAGRFGLSQGGLVGAIEPKDHDLLHKLFQITPPNLAQARVAPSVEALELLPGTLADRLQQWAMLQSVPEYLGELLTTGDMGERIELALMLRPSEVNALGLERALKLVNAPTRQTTRDYWRDCVTAILMDEAMPLPPNAPREIRNNLHLGDVEASIAAADVYLWLSQRPEFRYNAPEEQHVREMRRLWSNAIDAALLRRIEAARTRRRTRW